MCGRWLDVSMWGDVADPGMNEQMKPGALPEDLHILRCWLSVEQGSWPHSGEAQSPRILLPLPARLARPSSNDAAQAVCNVCATQVRNGGKAREEGGKPE